MFLNPWSLALGLLSLLTLFLLGVACRTAVRVIRLWDPASDSQRQIALESEIWLSSTLVQYGLGFQIISLLLYVLAADHFSQMLVGAMCATGALLANGHGLPLLLVKMAGVFLYGGWIVLHQLDISSEEYPLVRVKYVFLLLLLPLLLADTILLFLYLHGLQPDVITSCCAVVFAEEPGRGVMQNLFSGQDEGRALLIYYGWALILFVVGLFAWQRQKVGLSRLYGVGMAVFFVLALHTLITVFSSYIYAMPFHNCPFCMLKREYGGFGFWLYIPLFITVFCGMTPMLIEPCTAKATLAAAVAGLQRKMMAVSLSALGLYVLLSSWHYLLYMLLGGER
jgi:hypothetical protein